jgi:hypothetical protein
VGHNLKARAEPGEKILIWNRGNALKSPDSGELNQIKPSNFAWIYLARLGFPWICLGEFRVKVAFPEGLGLQQRPFGWKRQPDPVIPAQIHCRGKAAGCPLSRA